MASYRQDASFWHWRFCAHGRRTKSPNDATGRDVDRSQYEKKSLYRALGSHVSLPVQSVNECMQNMARKSILNL